MPKNASEKNHPHVRSNPKEKEWADIGATTVEKVSAIIQKHLPLTWHYLTTIASRESRKRSGEVSVRKNRPVDLVSYDDSVLMKTVHTHQSSGLEEYV
jgi:hypothetical protein